MCWISRSRAETRTLAQGLAAALRSVGAVESTAAPERGAPGAAQPGVEEPGDAPVPGTPVQTPPVPAASGVGAQSGDEAEEALVVALSGPLGAGKTLFAKGVAEALGIDPAWLQSPTFAIAVEFPLPPGASCQRLVHADFYRLESADELELAGLTDWLAAGTLLLVEWADRFADALPEKRLELCIDTLRIDREGENARRFSARAHGAAAEAVLKRWREQCP